MPPLERREYLRYTGALVGSSLASRRAWAGTETGAWTGAGTETDSQTTRPASAGAAGRPTELRTEYERSPNNVPPYRYVTTDTEPPRRTSDPYRPRFSWGVSGNDRGASQSAYRILVASTPRVLDVGVGDVWDSGRVESTDSTAVTYGGPLLEPDRRYYWRVRVWNEADEPTAWSRVATFAMAIPDDPRYWEGTWIGNHPPLGPGHEPDGSSETHNVGDTGVGVRKHEHSPQLRTEFTLTTDVERARAHVVTLGYGELYVNGRRIGTDQLNPGWTSYDHLALFSTYDVTDALEAGRNAIGVWLGRGWFSKTAEWPAGVLVPGKPDVPQYPTGVNSNWDSFGPPRALVQVNVEYEDGTTASVASDTSWQATSPAAPSPILENDVWDGETYDARNERDGWASPGFDATGWIPAVEMPAPARSDYPVEVSAETSDLTGSPVTRDRRATTERTTLYPQRVQPIRVTETFDPVSIRAHDGGYIVDFGQNFAGWVELTVQGAAPGDELRISYAERVLENGDLDMRSTRSAEAIDRYIAKGEDIEPYEPRFTYHGFRYVRVENYPGSLTSGDITGKVVHTDVAETGEFACSNDDLTQVQHNAVWGLRSNVHSLPTDCCQRDERLGWTGDAHMSVNTDLFTFDAVRLFEKWMRDHAVNQFPSGTQSDTIPHGWGGRDADPNWGKVRVTIPWAVYRHTGDERVLGKHYDGMKAYVDYWHGVAQNHIVPPGKNHYGDHLAPDGRFSAPRDLMNTFAHYQTTEMVANAAMELGNTADAKRYRTRADAIADAFNDAFLDRGTGVYGSGDQTSYVIPLFLDIVPDEHERQVVDNLVTRIRTQDGGTLQTGFVGTRPLLFALVEYGQAELAYHIVSQPERPGWVYMVRNGATTLWEAWNTLEALSNDGTLTSLNHRNWPLVSEWFYRVLAGITIREPGFERVAIAPALLGDLEWVEASVDTVRGTVASSWELDDGGLALDATVPWNGTALVRIPDLGAESVTVREGDRLVWRDGRAPETLPDGIRSVRRTADAVAVDAGAGEYAFTLAPTHGPQPSTADTT